MLLFYYFHFERNYDLLNSKSPWILLNKNINFNNSEKESKLENPICRFREANLALQLIWESEIKSKTVMSESSRKKKKEAFFVPFILSEGTFFHICVLYQCIVYWIHFQNIHTFTYQKTLLHTPFSLFLKLSKAFSVTLRRLFIKGFC